MNTQPRPTDAEFSPKERFRLRFQEGLREFLARHESSTQGFGLVWERTLSEVRLEGPELADLYWELLQWTRSYDLFTTGDQRQLEPRPDGR